MDTKHQSKAINGHIKDFLDYYIKATQPLGYAVMITGEWGAGKTFFLKNYMESFPEKRKFLYVSLYGVTRTSEIEDQLFQQLHPILSSRPVSIATKVVKSAIKVGARIDFDFNSDGTPDGSAEVSMPSLKIKDLYDKSKDSILIFDDLERCRIPINSILGYINHLVEHHNHKTILVAHEEELLRRTRKSGDKYKRIKEKLVGRTFSLKADVSSALEIFLKEIPEEESRCVLEKNRELITHVYTLSGYNNLRSLRQALNEFSRLYAALPVYTQKADEFLSHVIQLLLVFVFEIRYGAIAVEDIPHLSASYMEAYLREKGKGKPSRRELFIKKYPSVSFREICPDSKCWYFFFKEGFFPKDSLETSLKNSVYFIQKNTPDWVRLWHYPELDDSEFQTQLSSVEKNLETLQYVKPGIIKHVAGVFLRFSKLKIIKRKPKAIEQQVLKVIDKLAKEGKLQVEKEEGAFFDDGYAGLGFYENTSAEFKAIESNLKRIQKKLKIESHPQIAEGLRQSMLQDSRKFWEGVSYKFSGAYYRVPVLVHIKPKDFADAFIQCSPQSRHFISYAIQERYEVQTGQVELKEELEWLKKVKKQLLSAANSQQPLTRHIVTQFANVTVETAIKRMTPKKPEAHQQEAMQ